MRTLRDIYRTGDMNLAASLHALGIPPAGSPVRVKATTGDYVSFPLGPVSQDGKITADECMGAWDNPETFIKRNPEHPLSYIMAFIANLANLRSYVKDDAQELVVIERGRSILVLNPNEPKHIQDKFLRKMKI